MIRQFIYLIAVTVTVLLIAACGSLSTLPSTSADSVGAPTAAESRGQDVALFAMGLVETGYRFGGKNPAAGLDCSGMVSYVYENAAGIKLAGSAADMARKGRPVDSARLKPGDLVFFNTLNRPHSHVGIYIGDGRFVHAPKSGGKVRAEELRKGWFAERFEEARSYFN